MSLKNRLAKIETQSRAKHELPDWMTAMAAEWRATKAEFLARVPESRREAVAEILADEARTSNVDAWICDSPFARWAPAPPAGWTFPMALVDFWINPPRRFFGGHNCERCGLLVPLLVTWSNDPDPPRELSPFPRCPACGGRTTFAAWSARGPVTGVEDSQ